MLRPPGITIPETTPKGNHFRLLSGFRRSGTGLNLSRSGSAGQASGKTFVISETMKDLRLDHVVDVFSETHLFRQLNTDDILHLSRLGGQTGFSSAASLRRSTGIETRRILAPGRTATDIAELTARRLFRTSGLSPTGICHVLVCHSHADTEACSTVASQLADRLGLPRSRVSGFNFGCAGFLKLMYEGARLLESPTTERVALISAETPETWHDASDRLFCGIVSAGGTAALMNRETGFRIGCLASADTLIPTSERPNADPLFFVEDTDGYAFDGQSITHRPVMRMNPEAVFVCGIELMLAELRAAMNSLQPASTGGRTIVVPHQPSGKLLRALAAAGSQEFPQVEFLDNLRDYGNTISSSVPTILSRLPDVLEANNRPPLQPDDCLILLAAGICMQQKADAMSAGHAIIYPVRETARSLPQSALQSGESRSDRAASAIASSMPSHV